jgi:hypothetical protein
MLHDHAIAKVQWQGLRRGDREIAGRWQMTQGEVLGCGPSR